MIAVDDACERVTTASLYRWCVSTYVINQATPAMLPHYSSITHQKTFVQ